MTLPMMVSRAMFASQNSGTVVIDGLADALGQAEPAYNLGLNGRSMAVRARYRTGSPTSNHTGLPFCNTATTLLPAGGWPLSRNSKKAGASPSIMMP
jgi:hypothetical protein